MLHLGNIDTRIQIFNINASACSHVDKILSLKHFMFKIIWLKREVHYGRRQMICMFTFRIRSHSWRNCAVVSKKTSCIYVPFINRTEYHPATNCISQSNMQVKLPGRLLCNLNTWWSLRRRIKNALISFQSCKILSQQCFGVWQDSKLIDWLLRLASLDHILSSQWYLKQRAHTNTAPWVVFFLFDMVL